MNAREHFDWSMCRAVEYLDADDAPAAMASLAQDLANHPGTSEILHKDLHLLMYGEYIVGGAQAVRQFMAGIPAPAAEVIE